MAAVAAGAELSVVRVGVARRALLVLERPVARDRRPARVAGELQARARVAVGAFHGPVRAGQGVARLVVIEARRRLPVLNVVARDAVLVEGAAVRVFVAGRAPRLEPHPAQVRRHPLRETRRL